MGLEIVLVAPLWLAAWWLAAKGLDVEAKGRMRPELLVFALLLGAAGFALVA